MTVPETYLSLTKPDGTSIEFPTNSATYLSVAVEQTNAGELVEDVNGNLVDLTDPAFRKYRVSLSCRQNVQLPAVAGLWRGQELTVALPTTLREPGSTPSRTAVSGSVQVVGGYVEYRPVLTVAVDFNSLEETEWQGMSSGWRLTLLEKPAAAQIDPIPLNPELQITGNTYPGGVFTVSSTSGTPVNVTVTLDGVSIDPNATGGLSFTIPFTASSDGVLTIDGDVAVDTDPIEEPLSGTTWVIPLATQSNMLGRAADSADAWPANVQFAAQDGSLIAPSGSIPSVAGDSGPFTLAKHFAIAFLAARPNDNLIFVPGADGGTGFANGNWNPGDVLYENLRTLTNTVLSNNPEAVLRCVLVQGFESDAVNAMSVSAFNGAVAAFIDGLRSAWNAPDLPFVFGEMADDFVGTNADRIAIRDAALAIPQLHDRVAIASSRTPNVLDTYDNTHFTTAGLVELGARHYAALSVADTWQAPEPEVLGVTRVTSAESSASSSSYVFNDVPVDDGTVFVAVTMRGSGDPELTSVTVNGAAASLVGRREAATGGQQETGIYRANGVAGPIATVVVNVSSQADRCGIVAWSVSGAGSASFFSTSDGSVDTLSTSLDVPAGALVLGHATTVPSNGSGLVWYGLDQDISGREVSSNYAHTAASRLFSVREKYHVVAVEAGASMNHFVLAGALISPQA